ETMSIAGYTLRFDGVKLTRGPNFTALRARVDLMSGGDAVASLDPAKRIYPTEQQETVETAIRTTGLQDLYVALDNQAGGNRWVLRAYVNPLAPFIWFGAAIMALGGLSSLWG